MADEPAEPVAEEVSAERPPRARSRTPGGVWFAVVGTIAVGSLLLAAVDQVPSAEADQNVAESFLPKDGAARVVTYDDGAEWIVESAYSQGIPFPLQLPGVAGDYQYTYLDSLGLAVEQQRFWRQTWTDVAAERPQVTELYHLTRAGVRLMAFTGGPTGFSYQPGLIVLPHDVHDGSTWSMEGDALPQDLLTYTATGSATAGPGGCLVVDLAIDYIDPADGAVALSTSESTTWCPGEGAARATFENNGTPGSTTTRDAGQRELESSTDPIDLDLTEAGSWTAGAVDLLVRDPVFGESPYTGVTDGRSVVTADGTLVFASGRDLVAYREGDDGAFERQWIAHPGGEFTTLAAIGDAIIVGTTDRSLQVYDANGLRAWSAVFDDIVDAPPVADGDGGMLALSLDGELRRISLVDGTQTWSVQLDDASDVPPAVAGGRVFAVDRADVLRAVDARTGEPLWTSTLELPNAVAATDSLVVVADDEGAIWAHDAETGAVLWTDYAPGVTERLATLGDTVVVQGTEGTIVFDADGDVMWRHPATDGLLSDGRHLALLSAQSIDVVDAEGATVGQWPVDPETLSATRRIIPGPDGVWLITSLFQAIAVSAR